MIKQDQEIFNILIDIVSEAVIIIDYQHAIMEINTAAEHIFGYSKKELLGSPIDKLIPSNFHNSLHEFLIKFMTIGKSKKIVRSPKFMA